MPAKLLADENIPSQAISALRDAGCDVLSIRETTPGIPDVDVLRIAATEVRVLVTFDRDYGALVFGQGQEPPPTIVYFRHCPASPREVSEAVLALLDDAEANIGAMVIVARHGIRRRRFHQVRG